MQAVGIVNDHAADCFRFPVIAKLRGTLLAELKERTAT